MAIPKYDELFNTLLGAIKRLGGSASKLELDNEVTRSLSLTDEEITESHGDFGTELHYRLTWTRSYLKIYGLLDYSNKTWFLTPKGREINAVDSQEVVRFVRSQRTGRRHKQLADNQMPMTAVPIMEEAPEHEPVEIAETLLEESWKEEMLRLMLDMSPDAFERLCQRLLRESGFVEVKVTGRSGDGGIDGVGIVRLGGLLGFPILFQCKRYQGTVSASIVRDFRGAMIGRADRGLIITTGTFSRDAKAEATRDGAPPIDLLDGEQLLDKLRELQLGVSIRMIEEVRVVPEFFRGI